MCAPTVQEVGAGGPASDACAAAAALRSALQALQELQQMTEAARLLYGPAGREGSMTPALRGSRGAGSRGETLLALAAGGAALGVGGLVSGSRSIGRAGSAPLEAAGAAGWEDAEGSGDAGGPQRSASVLVQLERERSRAQWRAGSSAARPAAGTAGGGEGAAALGRAARVLTRQASQQAPPHQAGGGGVHD